MKKLVLFTLIFLFIFLKQAKAYVYLFVPDSNYNAISEVNITDPSNPREITRHRTVPFAWGGNPSRTAIDHYGNAWIGNRDTNTLIKVGNLGLGTCVDKNGNGVIDTSRDLNNNGNLDDDTIADFGQDECILMEIPLNYLERVYFGNSVGVRAVCIDGSDNVYAGMYGFQKLFYVDGKTGSVLRVIDLGCSPYGCIVDKNGIVWVSCINEKTVVKYNPRDGSLNTYYQDIYVYGITPTPEGDGLIFNGWTDSTVRKIGLNGNTIWSVSGPYQGRGITVDKNGYIYAVGTYYGEVRKYDKNGNQLKRVTGICSFPYGIGLDYYDNVWVACEGVIVRLDKELNVLNLIGFDGTHYVYSDWTGYLLKEIGPSISNITCKICDVSMIPSNIEYYPIKFLCLFFNLFCNQIFSLLVLGLILFSLILLKVIR
jgi:hypothetical protein